MTEDQLNPSLLPTGQYIELCKKDIARLTHAVTEVATGQNAKKRRGKMKHSEMMLMASPYRPRDQRRGGKRGPRSPATWSAITGKSRLIMGNLSFCSPLTSQDKAAVSEMQVLAEAKRGRDRAMCTYPIVTV